MTSSSSSCSFSGYGSANSSPADWGTLHSLAVSQGRSYAIYTVDSLDRVDGSDRTVRTVNFTDLMGAGLNTFQNTNHRLQISSRIPIDDSERINTLQQKFATCVTQARCQQFFDMANRGLGEFRVKQEPINDGSLSQKAQRTFKLSVCYKSTSDTPPLPSNKEFLSWNPANSLVLLKVSQLPLQIKYHLLLKLDRSNYLVLESLLTSCGVDNAICTLPQNNEPFQLAFSLLTCASETIDNVKDLFQNLAAEAGCEEYFNLANAGEGQLTMSQIEEPLTSATSRDSKPRFSFEVDYQLTSHDLPTDTLPKAAACKTALFCPKIDDDEKRPDPDLFLSSPSHPFWSSPSHLSQPMDSSGGAPTASSSIQDDQAPS